MVARKKLNAPRAPLHTDKTDERGPQHVADHGSPRRTRRRKEAARDDMFYIPVEEIPAGLTYEWKRWTVHGQEDPFYLASMREQGWEPVQPKKHANWLPPGYKESHIIKGGLILMERPVELTQEAVREQRALSRQRIKEAEQRLGKTPEGELTREHSGVKPRISKEVVRPMVVEE